MHLIIDGYNLLGARGEMRANAEPARERLLQELMDYRRHKGHPITVVFDGWRQNMTTERHEHRSGVQVIYSRKGQAADQVIQRLASEFGRDCAVVSSDREVADFARAQGAFIIGAAEFDSRLRAATRMGSRPSSGSGTRDAEDLDRAHREKKGNPRKLPKAIRQRNRRLKGF
ncbi:MAG: NYN domain-containing protein [Nitrospiraceae bacterium]|nr:NYN domain-containing protein [Nitrospiraceae bacterium]